MNEIDRRSKGISAACFPGDSTALFLHADNSDSLFRRYIIEIKEEDLREK